MKLVFGAFVWGRGGFSVRLSSRRSPPEIRATEVAPTHEEKVKCSFIYAKLNSTLRQVIQVSGLQILPLECLWGGEHGRNSK